MMGREEESSDEETNIADPSVVACQQKRHKKHKHKRHKKKKVAHNDFVQTDRNKIAKVKGKKLDDSKGDNKTREKLTSGKVLDLNNFGSGQLAQTSSSSMTNVTNITSPKVTMKKKVPKSGKGKDSGTSSEEERWLDAIESGKLEEVDEELKKIKPKDPKLMTARQRAMFERKTDTEPSSSVERLVSLPSGYKEKIMTAEAIQKAALKSLKRKQLADEKREKDKKKTMERLLKKQESKASKFIGKGKAWKRQVPLITYRLTVDGSWISLPEGQDFPLWPAKPPESPDQTKYPDAESLKMFSHIFSTEISSEKQESKMCIVEGCNNPKKYSCSKTGHPLCSLQCYKTNIAMILT